MFEYTVGVCDMSQQVVVMAWMLVSITCLVCSCSVWWGSTVRRARGPLDLLSIGRGLSVGSTLTSIVDVDSLPDPQVAALLCTSDREPMVWNDLEGVAAADRCSNFTLLALLFLSGAVDVELPASLGLLEDSRDRLPIAVLLG